MKKALLSLVVCLLSVVYVHAQQAFTGDFFSVSLPNNHWKAHEVPMEVNGQCLALYTLANQKDVGESIVICAIDVLVDPVEYINVQCAEENPIFDNATFDKIVDDEFAGLPAKSRSFVSELDGCDYEGDMVVFSTDESTYYILLYTSYENPKFNSVFETLELHQ
ncbi:MAG: hypothetical protein R3Y51_04210 [Rikenellaceae bacterium]